MRSLSLWEGEPILYDSGNREYHHSKTVVSVEEDMRGNGRRHIGG